MSSLRQLLFICDFRSVPCGTSNSILKYALGFIRLSPAIDQLGSECLTGEWTVYPWAIAIAMMSVFGIFILELVAFRLGVAYMDRLGIDVHDTHASGVAHVSQIAVDILQSNSDFLLDIAQGPERLQNAHSRIEDAGNGHSHAHGHLHNADGKKIPEAQPLTVADEKANPDNDSTYSKHQSAAQIVGVAILEFGKSL